MPSIRIVHALEGRVRFRMPFLRHQEGWADRMADQLSKLPGMERVEVRPFTASLLCEFDPELLSLEALGEEVKRLSHAKRVVGVEEVAPPEPSRELREAMRDGSGFARSVVEVTQGLNQDILRVTEGHLDLPMLAALGFSAAGLLEVLSTGKLPLPPWFNLGWWALRTLAGAEYRKQTLH